MSYKVYNYKCNYVTIVQIPKNELSRIDFAQCNQPTETLASFYNRQSVKPEIVVNGGLFNMSNGAPILTLRDERQTLANNPAYRTGFGIIGENRLLYGSLDESTEWRDFISGFPVLVLNGVKCDCSGASSINYKARRTVLGYNDDNIYIMVVESPGVNFATLQDLVVGAGIKYAINLDGGGSTKMLVEGKSATKDITNRAVDNVVAIYMKKEPVQQTIYRVQLGAFKVKANADALQSKVRALDDAINAGYKNAYVRLIDGLYKVQVGAFSKKENAERVLADLKSKGYSAFITTQ